MPNFILRMIIFILSIIISCPSNSQSLFPYLKDGRYGYADSSGVVIVEAIYEKVSNFGSSEMFIYNDGLNKSYNSHNQISHWPESLALVYVDSLYYLINNKGQQVLKHGVQEPIEINPYKYDRLYSEENIAPYLRISTKCGAGWGIWDNKKMTTEGLVYGIKKPIPSATNSSGLGTYPEDANRDLNPFRGGMPSYNNRISGCDCTKEKRLDGNIDLVSPYGEVVKSNIKLPNEARWANLSSGERSILRNNELKRLCSFSSHQIEKKEKTSQKRRMTPEIFKQERKQFRDSISQLAGKTYHETKKFGISYWEQWTCGLDTLENRIDIINKEGKIVHSAQASEIPKSITHNSLGATKVVFIKSENKRVLLNGNGKPVFPADQYQDILAVGNNFYLAFMNKDAAYPLHIYNDKWEKHLDYDVYGMSRGGIILVKNKQGEFFCTKLEFKDPVEAGEHKLLTFKSAKTKPPLLHEDKIPLSYTAENGPPILIYDYTLGLDNIDSAEHPRLLVSLLKQNRNRRISKSKPPSFFIKDTLEKKRLIAVKDNLIHLDTIVDKLVSIKSDMKAAEVVINDSTQILTLKKQNRSFVKNKIKEMYTIVNGKSLELKDANDKVIASRPLDKSNPYSLRPYHLIENRNLVMTEETEGLILDDEGKLLKKISREDSRWLLTSLTDTEILNPVDFEMIGKTFLKVNLRKPYLINLETMKVFKD